jgi:hypothetical protein
MRGALRLLTATQRERLLYDLLNDKDLNTISHGKSLSEERILTLSGLLGIPGENLKAFLLKTWAETDPSSCS